MKIRLSSPLALVAVMATLGAVGCKGDGLSAADADKNSGPDGKRSGAVEIQPNQPVTDEVEYDKGDQTDWKLVKLTGAPGVMEVDLRWFNPNSDMNVDVYDAVFNQIAASPPLQPGTQEKKVPVQIDAVPGTYYLRIQAPPHGGSEYTLNINWNPPPPPPPPPPVVAPPPEEPAPVAHHEHHHHGEHHEHHHGFSPENGVQGRIVSSYHEGGDLVLHIDKGSAAGVKVGTQGVILEGSAGANPLDGGTFEITEVVDENRSVGKSSLKSNGKNNRVSLNVK